MFSNRLRQISLLSLALCWPLSLMALSGDRDQPMHLEADSVSIDESTGVSLYQGNVTITQGSLKLWADKLWVYRKAGKTDKITSQGAPTRFRQMSDDQVEIRGQALRAEFYVERDEMLLFDNAVLEQGSDQFRSDRIIYNRASSQVKAGGSADGNGRVQVTIVPHKKPEP
jgi:lipopolysaccharide export system protein LptA